MMVRRGFKGGVGFFATSMVLCAALTAHAIDSEPTRRTLAGLRGVNVVVEQLQPDIQKYAQKAGIQQEQVKSEVEQMLKKAGIPVLTYNQWLETPGRPFLYVAINTHEYEKYRYAYNIGVQLRQGVSLEANPSMRTMAATWSINMTGATNVGKLGVLKDNLGVLVERFVSAWTSVNGTRPSP